MVLLLNKLNERKALRLSRFLPAPFNVFNHLALLTKPRTNSTFRQPIS